MATVTTAATCLCSISSCSSLKTKFAGSVGRASKSVSLKGRELHGGSLHLLKHAKRAALGVKAQASSDVTVDGPSAERFHLGNLGPQPGSRKRNKRKGRGIAAGQGASCGFGMRGQKSRSGSGVRRGFEGGQMPLYRRLPKLKGIAGGMGAGLPKYVSVNLSDIVAAGFLEGDEISLQSLKRKGLINPSGRDRRLPLKILGDGEVRVKFSVKAGAFSGSAKEKLETAGCTLITVPGRKKWVKPAVAKNQARAAEFFAKKSTSG